MQLEYDRNRVGAHSFGSDEYSHSAMPGDVQMFDAHRQGGNNHGIHHGQPHNHSRKNDTSSPSTIGDSDDQESARGNFAGGGQKNLLHQDLHEKKARHKLVEQNRREKKRVLCNQLQEMVDPGCPSGAK